MFLFLFFSFQVKASLSDQYAKSGLRCQSLGTNEYQCMVCNCFNEAGAESTTGQEAVGKVVMTRVHSKKWKSNTRCGIIKQKWQFSWLNPGHRKSNVPKGHSCFKSMEKVMDFDGHFADHYHNNRVRPRWARRFASVGRIGNHIFYDSSSRGAYKTKGNRGGQR